ncbi:glycosyltransferase family protein [Desertivirga xinjiangensis]|uniref:glycosyltransferase family protein n=1 Tax=Desertivirga xinjiangensis TaxID=539206 RepID=UPI00210CD36F|nr:glycosyltransferase [Pedobacter xinjiangensis]
MALTGKSIFILGTTKFDGPYESTTYTLAKYLARENSVYYIENPYTWKDYLKEKGSDSFAKRKDYFNASSSGLMDSGVPNLKIVITPPLLSINIFPEGFFYRQLLRINESIIVKRIKKVLSLENISDFVYINSFNFHYPNVADYIRPALAVYHCVDPLILPFDKKHGLTSEPILIGKSDLVICTSRELHTEKRKLKSASYFIPNAADISHSSKALDENLAVAEKIAVLPKPVIGYFGNIERRMDFELLKEVTTRNPDKSFAFVGPLSPEFIPDWFYQCPNVHLTGRMPYEEMPSIIKGFDIAMIPFKKDDVSRTIFPLKLFEYLGAGKPVLATDFNPDLEEFTKETVRYCNNADAFIKAMEEELANDSQVRISRRLQVAGDNTWDNRLNSFSELLENSLKDKTAKKHGVKSII